MDEKIRANYIRKFRLVVGCFDFVGAAFSLYSMVNAGLLVKFAARCFVENSNILLKAENFTALRAESLCMDAMTYFSWWVVIFFGAAIVMMWYGAVLILTRNEPPPKKHTLRDLWRILKEGRRDIKPEKRKCRKVSFYVTDRRGKRKRVTFIAD